MAQPVSLQALTGHACRPTEAGPSCSPRCWQPSHRSQLDRRWQRAARKASTAEWEALAAAYPEADAVSEELAARINKVCNSGLRHMLRADTFKVERFKDELAELGNHFAECRHKEGATFVYVLYKLAKHELPPEHESLQGAWRASFLRMWKVLEDSGWKVKMEGKEDDEEEDEEALALPDVSGGYFQVGGAGK